MVTDKARDAKSSSWKSHSDLHDLLVHCPFNMVTDLEGGGKDTSSSLDVFNQNLRIAAIIMPASQMSMCRRHSHGS